MKNITEIENLALQIGILKLENGLIKSSEIKHKNYNCYWNDVVLYEKVGIEVYDENSFFIKHYFTDENIKDARNFFSDKRL